MKADTRKHLFTHLPAGLCEPDGIGLAAAAVFTRRCTSGLGDRVRVPD